VSGVRWLGSVALNRADAADCQRIPIPGWFVWWWVYLDMWCAAVCGGCGV